MNSTFSLPQQITTLRQGHFTYQKTYLISRCTESTGMKDKGIKRKESKKRYFHYIFILYLGLSTPHQPWPLPPHIATMGTGDLHNLDFALPTCIPVVRLPAKLRSGKHCQRGENGIFSSSGRIEMGEFAGLEAGDSCLFGGENSDNGKVRIYPCTFDYLPHNRLRSILHSTFKHGAS